MELELHRLRVAYRKGDRLAYLGHLEVLRTLERSIRRSGLPFGVSPGFARHMRVQFSQALPVGAASECEYFDVGLTERIDEGEALARLRSGTPPALAPYATRYVEHRLPALEAWLNRSSWRVEIDAPDLDAATLASAIDAVAAEGSISYLRGTKEKCVDLASTLVSYEVKRGEGDTLGLGLETRSSNRGALRPAILLNAALARPELTAAGIVAVATRVTRVAQRHEKADGTLVGPLDRLVSA